MGRRVAPIHDLLTRPTKDNDCIALAPNLRPGDVAEVMAAAGIEPIHALRVGYRTSSVCQTIVHNHQVIGMFGVVPDLDSFPDGPRAGVVWGLGSPEIAKVPKSFMRLSKEWLAKLDEDYDILYNYVDIRNVAHIRWLRRCGFIFGDIIQEYGPGKLPFILFWRLT